MADGSFRATIGERVLVFAAVALDGGWLLTLDGRQMRVYSAARGDERYVSVHGDSYTLSAAGELAARAARWQAAT